MKWLSPSDRQLATGVWHPHLIIIRNLYSPNYSPSFKFVIVLDVSAKNVSYNFSVHMMSTGGYVTCFFLLINKPGPIVHPIRNIELVTFPVVHSGG